MKGQVKLTESELYSVVKESVKSIIREYVEGNEEEVGKSVKRGLGQDKIGSYSPDDYEEEFNKQPTNNLVGENKTIKLTESELRDVIKESVNNVLKEIFDTDKGQELAGRFVSNRARKLNDFAKKAVASGDEYDKKQFFRHLNAAKDAEQKAKTHWKKGSNAEKSFMKGYNSELNNLSEIKYKGKSLHGDKEEDWMSVGRERIGRYKHFKDKANKQLSKGNTEKANDLKRKADKNSKAYGRDCDNAENVKWC